MLVRGRNLRRISRGDIGAFGNEGRKPRVKNVEKVGGSYGAERVVLMSEMP